MTGERKPVAPRPGSCQRGGCQKPAEWVIRAVGHQGPPTLACTEHVGEMLAPKQQEVTPIALTALAADR